MIFPSFSLSSPPGPFRVPFGDRRVHIDVQFGRDDGAQGLHHRGYYFFSLLFLRRISSCRLSSSTFLCRSSFSLSSASLSCFQVSFLASAWRVFNFFFLSRWLYFSWANSLDVRGACGSCKEKVSLAPLYYPDTLVNPDTCLGIVR